MRRKMLLAFSAIFLAGCATVGPISTPPYYPSNPSAVLLKHQGEGQASASASLAGEAASASYALTSHLGLLASGSASLHKSGDPNRSQYSGDVGFGIFDTMFQSHIYRELYGGVGGGAGNSTVNMQFPNSFGWLSLWPQTQFSGMENRNFWNGWIQGDAGYTAGSFYGVFILRLEYVDLYRDVTNGTVTTYNGIDNYTRNDTTYSLTGENLWSLIPGLEARYDFGHLQLLATFYVPIVVAEKREAQLNSNTVLPIGAIGLGYTF
jgi:hypothetical protein